jgi:hypothetical protein
MTNRPLIANRSFSRSLTIPDDLLANRIAFNPFDRSFLAATDSNIPITNITNDIVNYVTQNGVPQGYLPNQVLVTNGLDIVMWINQCDFAGVNNTLNGLQTGNAGVVTNKIGSTSDCFRTLIPSGANQFLSADSSNQLYWNFQSSISGLNSSNGQTFNATNAGSGIVMNSAVSGNCLTTLTQPSPMPSTGAVLIISNSGIIQWEDRADFSSSLNVVTSVSTSDGILVGPPLGMGPVNGAITLSLDGWELTTLGTTKIFRPKNTGLNPGQVGDATHVVNQGYYNTLVLNNGGFFHYITTNATSNYNWITPTSNPITATRLITCDTSGNLGYTSLSAADQVLITDNTNTITWISQCDFAGMTSGSTVTGTAPGGASIVIHRNTASDCLRRFTPGGANLVLITTSPNVMQWIQQCDFAGMNNFITDATLSNSTFGVVINNGNSSQCLITLQPDGTSYDFQVISVKQTAPSVYDLKWSNFCDIFPYIGSPFVINSISGDEYITTASAPSLIIAVDLTNPPGSGPGTAPCIYKFQRPTAGTGCGYYFGTDTSNNMGWFEQGTIGGLGMASHEIDITITSLFNQNNELVLYNTNTFCLYRAFKPADTVLISDSSNQVRWINQCNFAGLNLSSGQTFDASGLGSGIVMNTASGTNCLTTLTEPSPMPATGAVLIISNTGIIQWEDRGDFSLSGSSVSSISSSDGILVNGNTGPAVGSITLSLDGWEIITSGITKIWRPINTGLNPGQIGDISHIINQGFYNTLTLNNGGNLHNITTSAIGNYNWITPSGNPTISTRLITVDISGNLNYTSLSTVDQVFITDGTNTFTWIAQCDFAGMTAGSTFTGTAPSGASIVIHRNTASDCLRRFTPGGPVQILTTDGTATMIWINQCNIAGLNTTSGITFNASGLGSGIVMNTAIGANCLTTLTKPSPMPSTGAVLIISNTGIIQWEDRADFANSSSNVTSIVTSDGILINGGTGPVTGAATLSLDDWEIQLVNANAKALRPKTGVAGFIGDINHVPNTIFGTYFQIVNTNNFSTIIRSGALSDYQWEMPSAPVGGSALQSSFIVAINNGPTLTNINYLTGTTNQVPVTDNITGSIIFINQCNFAGMNINSTNIGFNNINPTISGVVVNNGNTTDCLKTINPGTTALNAANKVFVTDGSGNMTWITQPFISPFRGSVFARTGSQVGTFNNNTPIPFLSSSLITPGNNNLSIQKATSSADFTYWWIQGNTNGSSTFKLKLQINGISSNQSTVPKARIYLGTDPGTGAFLSFIYSGNIVNPQSTFDNTYIVYLFEAYVTLNFYTVEPASYNVFVFQSDASAIFVLGAQNNFNAATDIAYELFIEQVV